ncbi:hypothetical protein H4R34_003301 [Dimargaris verticillata]|uniref:Kinase-like domain-containing protein n=1 Tax=Dimargaris verticillata TaxID=2761393 RepID=A0A9W8ECS1_9FUNG|nr:hypothetical protein H4R34_003301 [Dimargaris verticillata]
MPWTIDTKPVEFTQPTQILEETQDVAPTQRDQHQQRVVGKLIANRGGDAATEYLLALDQSIVIGRHRSCDIKVEGTFCSNHHCRLAVEMSTEDSNGFAVVCHDMSSNGTFVNRVKIGKGKTVLLTHGDTLEIRKGNYFTYIQTWYPRGKENRDDVGEEIVEAKYQITNRVLGTGTFAQVKLALCKETGQRLAAKIIDRQRFGSVSVKQHGTDFVQEINIMQSIDHPNIVRVVDVIRTKKFLYIFMPLVQGGDLFEYIMSREKLPEPEAKFVCYQILMALKYLHERNISHRDVKPENILLRANSPYAQIMLTDFGMARVVGKKSIMQTMCGTFQYIAPEVISVNSGVDKDGNDPPRGYSKMVDCWSLGVLLYAMLSGTLPFSSDDDNNAILFSEIRAGKITFPPKYWCGISDEAISMVRSLMVVDPRQRCTVHGALNHEWIKSEASRLQELYLSSLPIPDPSTTTLSGDGLDAVAQMTTNGSVHVVTAPYLPSSPVPSTRARNHHYHRIAWPQ